MAHNSRWLFAPPKRHSESDKDWRQTSLRRGHWTSRLIMSTTDTVAELCKVFAGNFEESSTPPLAWDDSSSSDNTWLRPCLKYLTQDESVQYSYYTGDDNVSMSYRVDFSTQTVYSHDLTVQLLRDHNDVKEKDMNAHSIAMQTDPWQVSVSSVPLDTTPSTKLERAERINRWGRATRERLWEEFCAESKAEREQKLLKKFRLAEKDLDDVTDTEDEFDEFEEQSKQLEQSLDAMESIW